jgi:transcriptional regulator with XRE-family HTH domain
MDVGTKLKFYRSARRMSLRDVASKADCSPSFLSQIELDRVSPTIKSLEKICRALGIAPADFLRPDPLIAQPVVIPVNRDKCQVAMQWHNARLLHVLPPEASSPFTALVLRMDVNGYTPPRHSLQSLKELSIVLQGKIKCQIGQTIYPLAQGESIYFDLSTPHQWSNAGNEVAEVLLTSPNSFNLFEQVENDIRWHVRFKRQRRKGRTNAQ